MGLGREWGGMRDEGLDGRLEYYTVWCGLEYSGRLF